MNGDSRTAYPGQEPERPVDLQAEGFSLDGDSWIARIRSAETPLTLGAIGEYRLECEVGRGAQGIVHRAVQPRTHRRIAIKRMLAGSLSDARTRARFEREIEIFAALQHPSIVTLYGVEYVDGLPVLAMEWVDGARVDQWSDLAGRDRLVIPRLLGVFLKICEAIQHAHQRGVIHRDIKPSNILVTENDEVRVLDFGLGKFHAADGMASMELTETGGFVGTPVYAAPEKLSGARNVSEVRSDVYSLGVVLFRMLAGRLPFDGGGSVSELLREMQAATGVRLSLHNATIPRDLDAVCAQAMAVEPQRRYASVEHLAEDVRRHLEGRPVSAVMDSLTYRASRFVRRNKWVVCTIAFVASTLLVASIVSLRFAMRESAARAEAERHARSLKSINTFLHEDLLSSVSPEKTNNPNLTMREALDRASERLERRLDSDPLVEASIRHTIGRTYSNLGLPGNAVPHLEQATQLRRAALGPEHADARSAMRDLIDALHWTDQSDRAAVLATELLALDVAAAGTDSADAMSTRHLLVLTGGPEDFDERVALLRTLIDWNAKNRGDAHPESLSVMHTLANDLMYVNRMSEAEPIVNRLWEVTQAQYGPAHPESFEAVMGRALFLAKVDRVDEAIELLEESIRIQRETMPQNYTTTGIMLGHLGSFYGTMGRNEDAERAFLDGYRILSNSLGEDIGWAQGIVRMLAQMYERTGDADRAQLWRARLLPQFEKG